MVAMGGGGVLVLYASKAIDGSVELEAAVVSDAAPLMVAQNWKWPRSIFQCWPLNRCRIGDKEATVDDTRAPARKTRMRADIAVSPR
jgi:hypothetical protein